MNVSIRRFEQKDIQNKIKWINDNSNNKYLHYDLPLEYDKTLNWFINNKGRKDRFDAIIEVDGVPVGLIGLLSIDKKNSKAEYYITLGEDKYKGKGIAKLASIKLIKYAFEEIRINKIYLFTEIENKSAQRLFEKIGFRKEGLLKEDIKNGNEHVDRYVYGICKDDYYAKEQIHIYHFNSTETLRLKLNLNNNNFYIKRDDLIPISFGGNKARKAILFFKDIERTNSDCVVTYGSSSSNHCRIIANIAASKGLPCYIISPTETNKITANSKMIKLFRSKVIKCSVTEVKETINKTVKELKREGYKPYFIQGGGHGDIGTQAYVNTYKEIIDYEKTKGIHFDYIFHASGTGTTQAGLICGKLLNRTNTNIIGISVARKNPYGGQVVLDSVNSYLKNIKKDKLSIEEINFIDDYVLKGYGHYNKEILETIKEVLIKDGIPLDTTYTGKAFWGMKEYIKKNQIKGKNILFIHTGGTPLFFDDLEELINEI
ncbi:pyridoxal-phosphate dependent enzyme [Anaerosalibacter bizertensis]|uniref:Pyridoxal-phosphate dependent enzyme n=1 Tax=Anaerosalibacter bizertensis TaxID=932217 RepID=A0A9Q4ADW9_9FIRM|nr:pyridoxal-phosphate dependent enzyme [Anaerosalibacter bizertensis]MCB5559714.1 pyridoxal-phosphate dependent enzyme [Anaerosalibacter bizertensis]MCG4565619.1 pyridoxal-phosphate dependent enzyme [Anaerosalibacter bizertensis]MCG4582627.1 pyridoxal-phosphate dependent enzyme [Anaerosalibacter bizertensis]